VAVKLEEKGMTDTTKKCFDILHAKMLDCPRYQAGYKLAVSMRKYFEGKSVYELQRLRHINIELHSQVAAGVARVCLEVIFEKTNDKDVAA
jgi:hypothetical protein